MLGRFSYKRAEGIFAAAAREGLWLEALDLLNHLSESQRAEMVAATLALDEATLDAILDTIIEHDLSDELVLIAEYDDTIHERLSRRQGV